MPLDPDVARLLEIAAANPPPPYETTPVEEQRALSRARLAAMKRDSMPVAEVRDLQADGVPVRLYVPEAGDRPHPTVLFFHGGGWVLCDLETHDETCRRLALASGCAIVSVDYRRAPEAQYPAAFDDCYRVLLWVAAEGARHGLDPDRLAVAGDSAGGNLAAAVAIAARDRAGPKLRHQLLIYPALDVAGDSESWRQPPVGLTPEAMRWFWGQYGGDGVDRADPLFSPMALTDLDGLPAATIVTAEYDILRDEGERFAERLRARDGCTEYRRFDGVTHGFASMFGFVAKAEAAMTYMGARLRAVMEVAA